MKYYTQLFPLLIILIGFKSVAETKCTITGEVLNRESKALLLRKTSENYKIYYENPVRIPITKGTFSYTFSYSELEAYELVFEDEIEKGNWKAIIFFPTEGTVKFRIFSMKESNKNTIIGGESNAKYVSYTQEFYNEFNKRRIELDSVQKTLVKNDEFESDEYKEIRQQLRSTKSDDYDARVPIHKKMDEMEKTHARYTEKAKLLYLVRLDSISDAEVQWKYEYIKNNVSVMSYYLIWNDVEMQIKNHALTAQLVADVFPRFEKKYPGHVYTKKISMELVGLRTIKPGNKYIDIKAPTIDGDEVQLSEVIDNHVALIDLWGSWCGPCIAKSRLVVPIYNQYKDQGFVIVGIAREFKNTDAVKKRLSKEQFSWLNLVELDDRQNIWNTYGISNGTGLMLLVDKDGTILAIDPKPDELEKILKEKLN